MPCNGGHGEKMDSEKKNKYKHMELDKYVDMLCRALKLIEETKAISGHSVLYKLEDDILDWWRHHKEWDKKDEK